MKKLFLIIIGLCLCTALYADMNTYIIGSGAVSGGEYEVDDDYTSDTSSNYTAISGSVSVSGGTAHGQTWTTSILYHETAISSADHWVEGTIYARASADRSGLIFRCDGTHYYVVCIEADTLVVRRDGSTEIDRYEGSYSAGSYVVKAIVSGTGASVGITISVDGVQRINASDTAAERLTSGSYVGIYFVRTGENYDVTVDDLTADNN